MKRIKNTNFKRYLKEIIKYNPRRVFLVFFMMIILMEPMYVGSLAVTEWLRKDGSEELPPGVA